MCYENVIFDFETISPEDAQNFHRLEEGYTYIRISDIDCYYLESYKDQPNKTTFNCIAITDKCEKYFLGFQVEGERFFGNKEIKKILCDFEVVE